MTNAILSQVKISDGRTLVLRRDHGKRKTRVLIESKPVHETDGFQFVHVLFCRDFKNIREATEKFNQLALT